MKKRPLNLSINDDLVERARNHGINVSAFLEIKLQEHLALIEGKSNNHNSHSRDELGAYGLVVMTSPSHGGGLRFKSG